MSSLLTPKNLVAVFCTVSGPDTFSAIKLRRATPTSSPYHSPTLLSSSSPRKPNGIKKHSTPTDLDAASMESDKFPELESPSPRAPRGLSLPFGSPFESPFGACFDDADDDNDGGYGADDEPVAPSRRRHWQRCAEPKDRFSSQTFDESPMAPKGSPPKFDFEGFELQSESDDFFDRPENQFQLTPTAQGPGECYDLMGYAVEERRDFTKASRRNSSCRQSAKAAPTVPQSQITKEILDSFVKTENQSTAHLNPFYKATVQRFLQLRELHEKYDHIDVKLSFIILDWDKTLHSSLIEGVEADEIVSNILMRVMTERKVKTTTANGEDEKDVIIVPFPIIVTCHANYLNMMFGNVLEKQKMNKTFDLVMGGQQESEKKILAELELDDDQRYYRVTQPQGNKSGSIYDPKDYTLPQLIEKLKIDGVISTKDIDESEVSRIRAYDGEDTSIGTSWNNNLRKMDQWWNWIPNNKIYTPKKLRFELPPKVEYVNANDGDNHSTVTDPENDNVIASDSPKRLNQIPFVSIDRDIWVGQFLTEASGLRQYAENPGFTQTQQLKFKKEMNRRSFLGLFDELEKQIEIGQLGSQEIEEIDVFNLVWDIVSIGDNERDHKALEMWESESDTNRSLRILLEDIFRRGIKCVDLGSSIDDIFNKTNCKSDSISYQYSDNRDLLMKVSTPSRTLLEKSKDHAGDESFPSIKSYHMKHTNSANNGLSFIDHLKRTLVDLDILMNYDGSIMVKREESKFKRQDESDSWEESIAFSGQQFTECSSKSRSGPVLLPSAVFNK